MSPEENVSPENGGAQEAAALLLRARQTRTGLAALPEALIPADEAAAYAIQRAFMAGLGEIGGWKVGAAGPEAAPSCAPIPAAWITPAPATLSCSDHVQREVESEIAFMIGEDLPPRETPYEADDVLDVVIGCHPAIEILQSRFADPATAGSLSILADLIQHGAFVWGQPIADWQELDFAAVPVVQTIAGGETKGATGNPAGDMIRLMVWLANEGAVWAGGLKAGQIVTCGSWTGKTVAPAGSEVVAAFEGAEPVVVRFE